MPAMPKNLPAGIKTRFNVSFFVFGKNGIVNSLLLILILTTSFK